MQRKSNGVFLRVNRKSFQTIARQKQQKLFVVFVSDFRICEALSIFLPVLRSIVPDVLANARMTAPMTIWRTFVERKGTKKNVGCDAGK